MSLSQTTWPGLPAPLRVFPFAGSVLRNRVVTACGFAEIRTRKPQLHTENDPCFITNPTYTSNMTTEKIPTQCEAFTSNDTIRCRNQHALHLHECPPDKQWRRAAWLCFVHRKFPPEKIAPILNDTP